MHLTLSTSIGACTHVYTTGEGRTLNEQEVSDPSLTSSWNSLYNSVGAFNHPENDSSRFFVGSQEDVYKELNEVPKNNHLDVTTRHQYQLSYELALDNMLTPFVHTPMISPLASSAMSKPK